MYAGRQTAACKNFEVMVDDFGGDDEITSKRGLQIFGEFQLVKLELKPGSEKRVRARKVRRKSAN